MRRCFVIQPFDKGPFDQRFDDVLVPAIKDADLEAYRVDKDPSVNIPIDSIETGIQDSEVCLADISLDNPNVWFEVGYAIAAKKGVVFICSETRDTPFPFDVQHHAITKYATASPRDFNELGRKITQRLKALLKSSEELGVIAKLSPTQETEGLAPHEVAALIILMEDSISPDASTSPLEIKRRMQHAGFTDIAVSIALRGLNLKKHIEYIEVYSDFGGNASAYRMTTKGLQWIQDNQSSLVLKRVDDDIPW